MIGVSDAAGTMGHMRSELTLPDDYPQLLDTLKAAVRSSQARAHRVVNTELLRLYWTIGRTILTQQDQGGWGAKVVDRLAQDLRREFPDMTGLSRSNPMYMRAFAEARPTEEAFVPRAVGQLPWGHVRTLLDKVADPEVREWYAPAAVEHGWSRNVLLNQIKNKTHAQLGAALSNFRTALPAAQSGLTQQIAKDPYVFDFLGLAGQVAERELEDAMMSRLQETLLELGHGLAFVGRQVHLDVDGDDFYIDLLFFPVTQLHYVVELKIDKFKPEYAGKLGFYVSAVDDVYRLPQHAPTVGLLLCADRSERVVRYALGNTSSPMALSTYTYEALPETERAALPAAGDVIQAVERPVDFHGEQLTLEEYFTRVERH